MIYISVIPHVGRMLHRLGMEIFRLGSFSDQVF